MTTATSAPAPVLITGNTYPHRQAMRDMGGVWSGTLKGWYIPADKADAARALVGTSPARRARFSAQPPRRGRCEDAPCCGCCD